MSGNSHNPCVRGEVPLTLLLCENWELRSETMNWVLVEDELPNEFESVLVSYGTLKAIAYFEYDDDKNICWFDADSQHG